MRISTLLTILGLAALSAGCQKAETEKPATMTLRATLTEPVNATPGTRLILGDDGLTCKWKSGYYEWIYLYPDNDLRSEYIFSVSSVSSDGRTAQFTSVGSLPPAGDYRVSTKRMLSDDNNIGDYDFDFTNDFFSPQKDQHGDGVLNAFICTQKVTVTEGEADLGDIKLVPAGALLEIPVKNSTGLPVVVDSLYMDTAQSLLYTKVWHPDGSFSDRDMKKGYSMTITDPNNTIADGETYRVYLSVMSQTISSDVTFKVITKDEKKEYSFTKPGKKLEAGLRYTVTGIELVTPD